ncbi:MAG: hypothetical protein IID37_05630 [Planctomycetes bacterium]|nr:hypothetical protein [Planctomycetota bacterium]
MADHATQTKLKRSVAYVTLVFAVPMIVVILDRFGVRLLGGPIRDSGRVLAGLSIYWLVIVGLVVVRIRHGSWAMFLRRRRMHLVLLAISSLLGLVVIEITMRIAFPGSQHPTFTLLRSSEFHHRNPRSTDLYWGQLGDRTIVLHSNSDGLRTRYSRDEFHKYKTRIAILGDSFAYGYGVQENEALPSVLQGLLRAKNDQEDVAVLNAAVISYSPLLACNLFDRVIKEYRPTLTILVLDLSDIGDDYNYEQQLAGAGGDDIRFDAPDQELKQSWLAGLALRWVVNSFGACVRAPIALIIDGFGDPQPPYDYNAIDLDIGGVKETNRFFVLRHPLADTEPYFRASWSHIKRMADNATENGSDFLLVVAPRFHQWSDRECPNNWESFAYALDEPYEFEYFRFFEQVRPEVSFPILILLPAFQETTRFPLVFDQDPHWNADGHRFVAEILAEHLIAEGLVD